MRSRLAISSFAKYVDITIKNLPVADCGADIAVRTIDPSNALSWNNLAWVSTLIGHSSDKMFLILSNFLLVFSNSFTIQVRCVLELSQGYARSYGFTRVSSLLLIIQTIIHWFSPQRLVFEKTACPLKGSSDVFVQPTDRLNSSVFIARMNPGSDVIHGSRLLQTLATATGTTGTLMVQRQRRWRCRSKPKAKNRRVSEELQLTCEVLWRSAILTNSGLKRS